MEQLFVNAIISGSLYSLVAIGFALTFRTAGFFNFAHGAMLAVGAYLTLAAHFSTGFPMSLCICLGILATGFLGCSFDFLFFRHLRLRSKTGLTSMITSIGIYGILQNSLSLAFGESTRRFQGAITNQGLDLGFAHITVPQAWIIISAILVSGSTIAVLRATNLGLKIRALADSADLASSVGVNRNNVILAACFLGSGLAALAGILMAFDVQMNPTMGLRPLMMAIVVVIVGGSNSIIGIVLAALLLGFAQQFAAWWLPAQWQDCVAFVVLVLSLILKPQGFFGNVLSKMDV